MAAAKPQDAGYTTPFPIELIHAALVEPRRHLQSMEKQMDEVDDAVRGDRNGRFVARAILEYSVWMERCVSTLIKNVKNWPPPPLNDTWIELPYQPSSKIPPVRPPAPPVPQPSPMVKKESAEILWPAINSAFIRMLVLGEAISHLLIKIITDEVPGLAICVKNVLDNIKHFLRLFAKAEAFILGANV